MEIEYKYAVTDLEVIRARALKAGFKFLRKASQQDTYFLAGELNFKGQQTYLRVREKVGAGNDGSLDYHVLISDAATDENEVGVADAKRVIEILSKLHSVQCVVTKTRETFERNNVLLMLDVVENLGTFVEVEIESDQDDDSEIVAAARELGMEDSSRINAGYVDIILAKNKK